MHLNPFSLSYLSSIANDLEKSKNLLLIHGHESSKETWIPVISQLKDVYNIYAIDLREHGQSILGDFARFTMKNMVADLAKFISECIRNTVFIIAHSMGARPAVCLAADRPDLVSGLIIVDMEMVPRPHVAITPQEYETLRNFQTKQKDKEGVYNVLDHYYPRRRIDSWFKGGRIAKLDNGELHIGVHPLISKLAINRISGCEDPVIAFKKLSQETTLPVLLLKAEEDSSTTTEGLQAMQKVCSRLTILEIPGSDHRVHKTALAQFTNEVRQFVG